MDLKDCSDNETVLSRGQGLVSTLIAPLELARTLSFHHLVLLGLSTSNLLLLASVGVLFIST